MTTSYTNNNRTHQERLKRLTVPIWDQPSHSLASGHLGSPTINKLLKTPIAMLQPVTEVKQSSDLSSVLKCGPQESGLEDEIVYMTSAVDLACDSFVLKGLA